MFLQYGPIYTVFMPQPTVVLMDYETIKECLVTKGEHFNGKKKEPPSTLLTHMPDGGILSSDGANWLEQRRTAIQILRNFGMGKSNMEEQVMRCVHDMVDHINSLEDKSAVNMFVPLQLCVGNVINQTLFGYMNTHDNCENFLEFVHIITSLFKLLQTKFMGLYMAWPYLIKVPLINLPYKQMEKEMSKYFDFIKKKWMISKKNLSQMLQLLQSVWLNVDQLRCVVSDFWIAGMETTSTTLRWAMLFMVKYPEIQKKAQEEIDQIVGKDRYVTMADKTMMPYVSALILELQRYANIVSTLMHESTSDQTIRGHLIPSGTVVMAQIHSVLASDPVFENPKEFRPERFLMEDGKTFCKPLANRLVQFGMGKRQCAGEVVQGQSQDEAISNPNSADFQIRAKRYVVVRKAAVAGGHYARAKRYVAVRRTVVVGGNRGYYGGGYPSYVVQGQSQHEAISNSNSADFQISRYYARAKRYIAVRRTVVIRG
uniref:Cytochrome P450 n=1 Tax=Ditylenchus dipsaci TaxID=166011 RepID=A0A915DYB8_9BILA